MKIAAIIPCHNEADTLGSVVLLAKQYVDKVIVVDNCSTDDTRKVAEMAGACVVYCEEKGMGIATKKGIMITKAEVIVTLDGDGQHKADEITRLVEPVLKGEADLVIGSRFINCHDQVPRYRKVGIDIITWLYNTGHKKKITDGQCCFRAYRSSLLQAIDIEEKGFNFSVEVLVKARKLGLRIVEVPVSCIYHKEFKVNSSMNPIQQGLSVSMAVIKWRLRLRN